MLLTCIGVYFTAVKPVTMVTMRPWLWFNCTNVPRGYYGLVIVTPPLKTHRSRDNTKSHRFDMYTVHICSLYMDGWIGKNQDGASLIDISIDSRHLPKWGFGR